MKQHSDTFSRAQTPSPRRFDERRVERNIDKVGDDGSLGQLAHVEIERRPPAHSEGAGVDDEIRRGKTQRSAAPGHGDGGWAEFRR